MATPRKAAKKVAPRGGRMSAAADAALDKKQGIKQGSPRDQALDKARGVTDGPKGGMPMGASRSAGGKSVPAKATTSTGKFVKKGQSTGKKASPAPKRRGGK